MENLLRARLQKMGPSGSAVNNLAAVLSVRKMRAFYFKGLWPLGELRMSNILFAIYIEDLQSFAWSKTC